MIRRRRASGSFWLTMPLQLSGAHFPEGRPLEQRALNVALRISGPLWSGETSRRLVCDAEIDAGGLGRACARGYLVVDRLSRGLSCELSFIDESGRPSRLVMAERLDGIFALTRFRGRIVSARPTRQVELRADWRQLLALLRGVRIERKNPANSAN